MAVMAKRTRGVTKAQPQARNGANGSNGAHSRVPTMPRIVEDERNFRLVEDGTVLKRFMKKKWTRREVECFREGFLHGRP